MDPTQASAPADGARLVAVRADSRDAVAMIDEVWRDGDAALPLDPSLSDDAALAAARYLGAAAMVDRTGRQPLSGGTGVRPGTALVVRTSGATGTPRGVVLGHAALAAGVAASVDRLDAGDARWLAVLPVHHVAGLLVVLRARVAGVTPIVHDRFDVAAVAAAPATHVALVPTMLHRLLESGVDVARFDRILLGGAAPPDDLLARATAAGARVTVSYGMTETCGGCVYGGLPLDGVAVAVDPDDRILLRGDVLADGYRTADGLTPLPGADGWFRSSDVGGFVDGRLVVSGRADDVIVSGGVNVSTAAVATLLRSHAGVADAAVVGVADPEWGQQAIAFVVPVTRATPPAPEALRRHVADAAGDAMAPRRVLLVDALPRTALGKIDRGALRRDARPGPGRDAGRGDATTGRDQVTGG
ncbi:MAG TPA: AMP-binding protein [Euzebyales bacterium]